MQDPVVQRLTALPHCPGERHPRCEKCGAEILTALGWQHAVLAKTPPRARIIITCCSEYCKSRAQRDVV